MHGFYGSDDVSVHGLGEGLPTGEDAVAGGMGVGAVVAGADAGREHAVASAHRAQLQLVDAPSGDQPFAELVEARESDERVADVTPDRSRITTTSWSASDATSRMPCSTAGSSRSSIPLSQSARVRPRPLVARVNQSPVAGRCLTTIVLPSASSTFSMRAPE
ncbi:MAG: hypothetical protein ACRDIW_10010 [Actinomycetota bacterium]